MKKFTSMLMLLLLALTGSVNALAQEEITIEYEAYPGWYRNNVAAVYWVGFLTPGTEDKTYKMSAFQYAQETGYGAQESYTAIATTAPSGSGAVLSQDDVLAVSTNSVLSTTAAPGQYETYNLDEEIELSGGTVYYMVFIADNTPNDEGMYTVQSQRVSLLTGQGDVYAAGVLSTNGNTYQGWIPGFKATLTSPPEDMAMVLLDQILQEIQFDASSYQADVPGGYPQELIDNCQEAYDNALDIQTYGGTYDEIMEAINNLRTAYDTLLANIIPVEFTPGYYYMVNARAEVGGNTVSSVDELTLSNAVAAYSDSYIFNFADGFNAEAEGEDAEPAYIWNIQEDANGNYTLQNVLFGNYVDNNGSSSSSYGFTLNVADAGRFAIETSSAVAGMVFFRHTGIDESERNNSLCTSTRGYVCDWQQDAYSSWLLIPVSEETVAALDDKIAEQRAAVVQAELNDTLAKWYAAAVAAREAGRTFIFDGTNDGQFVEGDGLLLDETQVWTNSKQTDEGTYAGLFDNVVTNSVEGNDWYFHTAWGTVETPATEPHYLQMDLGEEVQTLVLKYAVRGNASAPDLPYNVVLYGTNDPSLLANDTDTIPSTEWENLGEYTMNWQYPLLDAEGNTVSVTSLSGIQAVIPNGQGAGVTVFELEKPYQYFRLSVIENIQHIRQGSARTNGDGFDYWTISELRAYSGEYDPDCVYAHMDAEAIAALENAIADGKAELAAEAATQETIDALKAAYEAFMAVYPDKNTLLAAIEEAQSWIDPAVEGDEIGYYPAGSKDALQAVVDEATSVSENTLTFAIYNETMTNLATALRAFIGKVNVPETGFYNIQSLTTGAANENYLVARTTSTTANRADGGLSWNYAGENLAERVNALWYVEKLDNGKFTLKNVATGLYMDNTQTTLSGAVAQVAEPAEITLRAARDSMGYGLNFVINEEEGLYGNADPVGIFVVWSSGQGNDNSAWQFLPANYEGTLTIDLVKPISIHTLPFEILNPGTNVYAVAGITEDGANLALNAISGSTIAAGTPFVVIADTSAVKTLPVYLVAEQFDALTYTREALDVNGLVGTLQPDTIDDKGLVLNTRCTELVFGNSNVIAANSGYFVWTELQALPAVSSGDQLIALTEDLVSGIATLPTVPATLQRQGVYTLQGQKIADTHNLPAGIYIINGRKVLVK
ncbi:MAG: hypothetical protein J6M53_06270 [Bacteroidaceae bacterium]|nr:hypothetical protein [Bacteroidaceae bacterium]